MRIKIGGRMVDVVDAKCAKRPCLQVGTDHGPFVQGRGYTNPSGHTAKLVCLRRHLHGCPVNSVCPTCRSASIEDPGAPCTRRCSTVTVAP